MNSFRELSPKARGLAALLTLSVMTALYLAVTTGAVPDPLVTLIVTLLGGL